MLRNVRSNTHHYTLLYDDRQELEVIVDECTIRLVMSGPFSKARSATRTASSPLQRVQSAATVLIVGIADAARRSSANARRELTPRLRAHVIAIDTGFFKIS